MKKLMTVFGAILLASFILTSCGDSKTNDSEKKSEKEVDESTPVTDAGGLDADLLGNYQGVQPSYFMKNKYGDDMVINGNKVSVPSNDNKFLLKDGNVVSLQQINLEDNSRVYYDGTYKIISQENNTTKIECSLSDGKGSNPTYLLTIDNSKKKGVCTGSDKLEFNIEKIK